MFIQTSFLPSLLEMFSLYALIYLLLMPTTECLFAACPSSELMQSLLPQSILISASNKSSLTSKPSLCECTMIQEGGWEIMCYSETQNENHHQILPEISMDTDIANQPNVPDHSYGQVPIAFIIKYYTQRRVEVTCLLATPNFKPAMFQGFGIESIDTFYFDSCSLPSLPLRIILHRVASPSAIRKSDATNVKENKVNSEAESQVRVLFITSRETIKVNESRLHTLFHGLDSLEQLKLSNIQLDVNASLKITPSDIRDQARERGANKTSKFTLKTRLSLSFGQSLPALRRLVLDNFLSRPFHGILAELLKGLKNLNYLELTRNQLVLSPKSIFYDAQESLKKLYIFNNMIKELDAEVFENMTQLEILDLSLNQLTHLSPNIFQDLVNLKHLNIRMNWFSQLPDKLLMNNKNLESFDASKNRNITDLPASLLHGLDSLSNFSMTDCQISHLSQSPEQFFIHSPNLKKIELKSNKISNLTVAGLFGSNTRLSKLDLSYNSITSITKDIFSINSSNLIELNLYGNELTSLPDDSFFYLRSLRKLNLGFNNLTETTHNLFLHFQHLEELDLNKNQLVTIHSRQSQIPFGLGSQLRRVNLSKNKLTDFESDVNTINWSLYTNIGEIDLRDNQFSGVLHVPIFTGSSTPLISLDLRSNNFTSVNIDNLLYYENILGSTSSDSEVENEKSAINSHSYLTRVFLDHNPIVCDCHLEPFLKYAQSPSRPASLRKLSDTLFRETIFEINGKRELTCASPEKLKMISLENVHLSQLECDIIDERVCPNACVCSYRASDRSAIINCDDSELQSLPDTIKLDNYRNITLIGDKSANTINDLDSVIFHLRFNEIQSIEVLSQLFSFTNSSTSTHPKYLEIYLDHNNISYIPEDLLSINSDSNNTNELYPQIKVMSLKHNLLTFIPMSFLRNFTLIASDQSSDHSSDTSSSASTGHANLHSANLFLGDNPYNCSSDYERQDKEDCQMREFKSWLTSNHKRIGDIDDIKCEKANYNSSSILVEIPDEVICPNLVILPENEALLLTLTIICVILALSLFIMSVLYYRNKQTILAFIYIHFTPIFVCLSFTSDDLDEDKIYDAFVSYSSADRDIVMQLIEKLEGSNACNNEENLMLQSVTGASIHEGASDQIVPENQFKRSQTSLSKQSRVSLSQSAINNTSIETTDENQFKLCIHERDWLPGNLISWNIINSVKNSKRTVLILSKDFIKSIWFQVEFHTAYYQMLEDKIDRLIVIVRGELPPKEEMDKDLVFLLTTKTYLVWGEKWFWEKLRYALPHKNKRMKVNDMEQSIGFTSKTSTNTNGVRIMKQNGIGIDGSKSKSSEVLKDYVDKTIANHFQLDMSHSNTNNSHSTSKSLRNSSSSDSHINSISNNKYSPSKVMNHKNGHDNKSFVTETPT